MITLVKFIRNKMRNSPNRIVTRTLGKVGVIQPDIYDVMHPRPQAEEFWYCEILYETNPGSNKGVFVLNPFKKVETVVRGGQEEPNVVRLIPGTFSVEYKNSNLYLCPANFNLETGPNWILDLDMRRYLLELYRSKFDAGQINSIIISFPAKNAVTKPIAPTAPPASPSSELVLDLDGIEKHLED